ncbi:MAG: Succinate dehydrogenase cytochrome b556 subunit [Alphaproteobacteria bacterium MarineAlpha3_Bin2]|jgi:succinate dehydrogenase / fumarate reductase cytochrome b subunit|nr:MAG: Succinate dehydrogenase cytochrome b556 subunit [Alphaproteobacteria bacterium MarineAlpha3_Bin2]
MGPSTWRNNRAAPKAQSIEPVSVDLALSSVYQFINVEAPLESFPPLFERFSPMPSGNRPLSPHLQVYRPQLTSILSILHRITGVVIWAGAVMMTYWIASATYGPEAFARAQWFLGSWFGRLVLLGLTGATFYHLANGIRHLAWDIGWGYEMDKLNISGWAVLIFTGVMTVLTFLAGYWVAGAI